MGGMERSRRWWGAALVRAGVLGTLWLVISRGDPGGLGLGVPVVLLATWLSLGLLPPATALRAGGLLAFVPWFLWRSLEGGVDVALRVLHPALRIEPAFETFESRLQADGPPIAFLVAVVGLLPGTLCAEARGRTLTVHRIGREPVAGELRRLEERVAVLFGVGLREDG